MPVMMVMGELTEKLQTVIEHQIIPQLQQTTLLSKQPTEDNIPVCTFIFDREAYEPAFFRRLWEKYKIAIITYRKNVKDKWPVECFKIVAVSVLQQIVNMQLCEHGTHLGGYWFREVRRHGETGHQTSIVTTHPTLELPVIAGRMFGRWSQENFFRYLIEDYDFDKMVSFGIEPVDPEKEIVNPQYRKLTHQLKKLREKIQRIKARCFPLIELAFDQPLDDLPAITNKQMEYKEQIDFLENQEKELINQRSKIKPRLKVCQMPLQERYNKLKTESKLLMNVIKMICYRAESSVAQWIAPYLAKAENEKRMVVKQIIQSCADLTPDYENKTLTVTLHSLSAARYNHAANELTKILNQTETIFPGTDLKMIFEITANLDYVR
jgi:chaperonin cofactor prefoldin